MAKDEGVTIKLGVKPKDDHTIDTYNDETTRKIITVTRSDDIPNFYRYTHKVSNGGGQQFILEKVQGDYSQKLEGIPPNNSDKKVTSVSAYYWTGNTKKVVLVEVAYTGQDGTRYYKDNGGDKWVEQQLDGNNIEKVLDEQNCYNSDAVTLDLTKDANGIMQMSYCCTYHKDGGEKVTVKELEVNHNHKDHQHGGPTKLYKHSIQGGILAGIKYGFAGGKKRKTIKLDGSEFPMEGVESISALYSDDNQEPILIYVDSIGDQGVTGWYRSTGSDTWTRAPELDGITPEEIQNNCDKWNSLVKGLKEELKDRGENGLQECEEDRQPRPEPRAESYTDEEQLSKEEKEKRRDKDAPYGPGKGAASDYEKKSEKQESAPGPEGPSSEEGKKSDRGNDENDEVSGGATVRGSEARTEEGSKLGEQTNKTESQENKSSKSLQAQDSVTTIASTPPPDVPPKPASAEAQRHENSNRGSTPTAAPVVKAATPIQPPGNEAGASHGGSADSASEESSEGKTQAVFGLATLGTMSLGTISGISSGTLAGAGATFFGGWKLYKSRSGGPWVIHGYSIEFLKNLPY